VVPRPEQGLVVVTGATGFVGRHLVPALAAAGWRVRAALRRPAPVPGAHERVVVGEVGPRTDWGPALEGAAAVVHLAGLAAAPRGRAGEARCRAVNALGTERLAGEAGRAGVACLVFLSTVKVHGETSGGPLREDAPVRPEGPYALSKWEAEERLRAAAPSGLRTVVLRPPLVYGPGVKGAFRALLAAVARGVPLPLATVRNRRSLVAAANLAEAVRRCLERSEAAGPYLVGDGRPWSTPELVERLAGGMGRRARLFPCAPGLLRKLLRGAGLGGVASALLDDLEVDDTRLRRELGWRPVVESGRALVETGAWYREARRRSSS